SRSLPLHLTHARVTSIRSYCLLHPSFPPPSSFLLFFFFNDTATTEIYTLSLHDALPTSTSISPTSSTSYSPWRACSARSTTTSRSEEHTSELQSLTNLVCRLLLEKKKHSEQLKNRKQSDAR